MALQSLAFRAFAAGFRRERAPRNPLTGKWTLSYVSGRATGAVVRTAIEVAIAEFPILGTIPDIRFFLRNQYHLRGISPRVAARKKAREEWALRRAKLRRIHKRNLQEHIDLSTRRRSGKLRRCYVSARQRGQTIVLRENFPRTKVTWRGRRGSGSGQYAWIVNGGIANRRFVQRARAATRYEALRLGNVAFINNLA